MSKRIDERNALDLTITAATGREFVPFLTKHVTAAHQILSPKLAELSLALVGDQRMSRLHQQFMGIPGPTDVLTFPLDTDARGRATAGEVVVCVPEARRRAPSHAVSTRHELLLYAIHGLLHLCGFDDRTARGFRDMHRREDEILTQLGVGPVFDPAVFAPLPGNRPARDTPGRKRVRR